MKIGVSSYSYQRLLNQGKTYFEICDHAKKTGFDAIEFTDLNTQNGKGETTQEDLAVSIREYCEKIGLEITAYTIGADLLNGRGCAPAEEPERLMGKLDIAALLGAKIMRHDVFWSMAGFKDWRGAVDKIVPAIREVSDYAAEKGIRTCTENHGLIMQDSERLVYLMRAVDHANYGWLVDMGNFLCADEAPQHAVGIAAPWAVHVHAKDFLFKSGEQEKPEGGWLTTRGGNYLRGTVAGHGVVPVRACVNILKAAGYQGTLSLEFEGMEENLPAIEAGCAYLRKLVQ